MTDHLADARACIHSAAQAPHTGCTLSWLTATCEQIIAHLEAQQTEASLRRGLADITAGRTVDLGSFAQPATDPPAAPSVPTDLTAPHSEPEQLGGSDFMDWMADRLADPEVRAGYLAAHEREVRAQIASELIPVVAHKGPNDTDLSLLDEAAHKLEHGYSFGSNVTAAVVRLIRNAIHIAQQEQP